MKTNTDEDRILREFREKIELRFPGQIERVLLFGSMARGDATAESDIDVLVIVTFDDWKKTDEIRAIGYSLDLDIGSRLSIQVLPSSHVDYLRRNGYQFIQNVERDCVAV
jgi:predicted nucleotidyltransferase